MSCAYLLCRIADTIEDDPKMAPSDKVDELNTMSLVFDGAVSSTDFHDGVMGRLSANEAETALMDDIPRVFARFGSYPDSVRAVISEGVRIMCAGMGAAQTAGEVRSRHDLDLYCYSVAGVVGELLAELFMQRSPEMAKERDAVMALAVSFGEGLQMTNILKDVRDDAERGVCWLPAENGNDEAGGQNAASVSLSDEERSGLVEENVRIAAGHLLNAVRFILKVPPAERGIRKFCSWAVAMAFLTLRNISANPSFSSASEIKITRKAVKRTVILCNLAVFSNWTLRMLFRYFRGNLGAEIQDEFLLKKQVSSWQD